MKESHGIAYIADGIAVIMTGLQTNEVFQLISLLITIVASLFSVIFTAIRLIYWFKEASKDGKLTDEEIQQGKDIIQDGKNQLDDINKKGD